MNFVKDLLVMSFKQKAEQVNWKELGGNASYLPLIYFAVMAPGFLGLLGFCCLLAGGIGYKSLADTFPSEFFFVLGGSLIACGALLMASYRLIINYYFRSIKVDVPMPIAESTTSHLDQVLAPFLNQLKVEQQLFLSKDP